MEKEIEKKFLVKEIPNNIEQYECIHMEQCYISISPVIRLRKENEKFLLNIKGNGLMIRKEFEIEITEEEYNKLILKRETPFINKVRYKIPIKNNFVAELDIYNNKLYGLITVEVEFRSEKELLNFISPDWFGKDITFDKRYKNVYLSLNGIPK